MKNRKSYILTFCFALVLFLAFAMTGCGGNTARQTGAEDGGEPITFWMELNPNLTNVVRNYSETELAQEWSKRTGVNVQYVHPSGNEQFNLMLASNDLPDIIEFGWLHYPGGPTRAMSDNHIISINDLIESNSPNLKKYLHDNPEIERALKTDEGDVYMYPFIRGDESLLVSTGPIIRKDWLDELGLDVPETIDDWYRMLTAFKNEKNSDTPLVIFGYDSMFRYGAFCGAYGVVKDFFVNDENKVEYGSVSPKYKEFLTTMNQWYREGLLDNNFMGTERKIVDSSMLNGKAGATVGALGGGMGMWLGSASEEGYDLVGAPWPVLNKGERHKFSSRQNMVTGYGAAITTNCKNTNKAAKFLDYVYSEEGTMLMNFGKEGVSYELENDYPKYTELITSNPNGLSMAVALSRYSRATAVGAFIQDKRYIEQYAGLPQQQKALSVWLDTDAARHMMPPITSTSQESVELNKIMNDIKTLEDEMTVKFIMGQTSLEQWDSYVNNIKALGLHRAVEIKQLALDRFNSR